MLIVCYYYFMANYAIGLVQAFRIGLDSARTKGRTQIHFQGKDTDSFSSGNAFKNNDALWALCKYKVIHAEEVGD